MTRRDVITSTAAIFEGSKPQDIVFVQNSETVLTLTADGQIKIGKNVKPDYAAKRFLETLAEMYPQWIKKPCEK